MAPGSSRPVGRQRARYEDAKPPARGTTQRSSRCRRMCRALPRCSASQQVCRVRSACLPRTHGFCHRPYHSRHGCMKRKPMRCAKPCTKSTGLLLLGWAVDADIGSGYVERLPPLL